MDAFGGLKSIEMLLRAKAIKMVDLLKKANPYMQLFYDSELDSEIEKNSIKSLSDAVCSVVSELLESFRFTPEKARALGSIVAYKVTYTMGISKLIDMFFRNEISQDLYYYELSKRITIGAVCFIENNWKAIGLILSGGTRAILAYIGVPPLVMKYFDLMMTWLGSVLLVDRFSNYVKGEIEKFFDSLPVQIFIERTLRLVGKAVSGLMHATDIVVDVSKKAVNQTKKFLNSLADTIGVGFKQLKSYIKHITNPNKEEKIEEDEIVLEDE